MGKKNFLEFFFNKKVREILLIWLIIFVSMMLRVYKMDYYPIHNNDDSLFHVWSGTSSYKNILKPTSLSIFTQNNKALFWYSQYNHLDTVRRFSFRLEQPYLDQPPLAMFFIALPAKIFGFDDFVQVPQILVRVPAIVVSIFSLYLTYILAEKIFNQKIAMLSLLTYGLTPFYIFSHRQSYLENFITPVFLFSLINLRNYLSKPTTLRLFFLILTSLIAGWIKIIGFSLSLIISFWFLKERKIKPFLIIFFTGLLSLFLYLLYGFLVNWEQFKFILSTQAGRGMYLSSFLEIISQPKFYEPFPDGIYILNFIAMVFVLIKKWGKERIKFLSLNFVFWLILVIFTTDPGNPPWYRYPLFPFLSIAGGYYLNSFLNNPTVFVILPLLLFGFTGIDLLKISINTYLIRIIYILILIPFLFKYLFPLSKKINFFCNQLAVVVITTIFIINSLVPLKYLSKRCKVSDCLIPEKIVINNEKN